MEASPYISIDEYVQEQIQISLGTLCGPGGRLEGHDIPTLIPQIDYSYRRPAEVVSHFAKQVNLVVLIPAQRANAIGGVFAFFEPLGGHVNTEFSFVDAYRWLRAYREAKELKRSIPNKEILASVGQVTRL